MSDDEAVQVKEANAVSGARWVRLAILLFLIGSFYLAGKLTGFLDSVDIPSIRARVDAAGALGVVVFCVLFAVGAMLQVPGLLFVGTGILVWGRLGGSFASMAGASLAVCASFLFARAVGGDILAQVRKPWIRAVLTRLEKNPVRWLVILRLFVFTSPPLNYALALTSMRFRDYAIGSLLGLVAPMIYFTLLFDTLFQMEWLRPYLF